jgi:NNP family nitrate/nitrite transporter-like MFS transporter
VTAWRLVRVHFMPLGISYVVYGLLAALLVQQVVKILRVNRHVIDGEAMPAADRYSFSQVAVLCLCYAVTFGGELAVEQMLPAYFEKTFNVSVTVAGVMGAGFAFANFIARPLGGILGDCVGRKPIMVVTLAGSALGFLALPLINSHWSLSGAMALTVVLGLFLMAGNGANFCIAPLIRKPLTGQIAGLIGAYGSVGSVCFMTILLLTNPLTFFISMGITAAVGFVCCCAFLREPGTHTTTAVEAEALPVDGALAAV